MVQKFHERFEIKIDREKAEKRFVNRAYNVIFDQFYQDRVRHTEPITARRAVATALGKRFEYRDWGFEEYIEEDFLSCLQAIEAFYGALKYDRDKCDSLVRSLLVESSEIDLGVKWENGYFIRTGAKELDESLVNEPLRWLREKKYESVLEPFSKGLAHFLQAESDPKRRYDVITDMYESLEALSKIITERPTQDLAANAELFIKKVKASKEYKRILKEYISYAQNFRHAVEEARKRPEVSIRECESFVYLTGVFIRLAIQ